MAAVTQDGWALEYRGDALEYASEEMQKDKEVVLTAVTQN